MAIERAPEIERLLEESRRAFRSGDVETMSRMTSRHPSALVIGTDPAEVWRGHDAIVTALEAETRASGDRGPEFIPGEATAYSDGDVGWAIQFGAFRLTDGTEIPTRSMSVLHREDGEWKFVQACASLGVPNSALEAGSALAHGLAPASR